MKKLILFVGIVVLPIILYAQTKQIAHKSHSGRKDQFNAEAYRDNFGLNVEAYYRVHKVKLIKNNCIIEFRSHKKNDTICDHPYVSGQYTFEQIKTFYPIDTEFIGFEKKFYNDSIPKPLEKRNTFSLLAIFLFLFGGLLILMKPIK